MTGALSAVGVLVIVCKLQDDCVTNVIDVDRSERMGRLLGG